MSSLIEKHMVAEAKQFVRASNTYLAWLATGKDYANFQHVFEEWDFECKEYMHLTGLNRMQVINQIAKANGIRL